MEFHLTVHPNGSIGNSLNSSNSHQLSVTGETTEKYVPYWTKKELTSKLDSKIEDMSLIMVQMDEMKKRLQLQEKLIAEYEEKAQRQNAELQKLKMENDHLRSMVFKRKRVNSCSSIDSPMQTSPKTVGAPMDTLETDINIDLSDLDNDACEHAIHEETDNMQEKEHEHANETAQATDDDYVTPNSSEVKKKVYDNVDRVLGQGEGIPLFVDENGYVPIPVTPCGNKSLPRTSHRLSDDIISDESVFQSGFSVDVELTYNQKWCTQCVQTGVSLTCNCRTESGTLNETVVPNQEKNTDRPNLHKLKTPRYIEIPPSHFHCQATTQCKEEDHYKERPPMPLPGRRVSESSAIPVDQPSPSPGMFKDNGTSKTCIDKTNEDSTETHCHGREGKLKHRHSSPDFGVDVPFDDKVQTLIQNMKTTMEWNESRKLMMSKSHTCTTEMAEDVLKRIVKDTYHKCATRLGGTKSKDNLAQNMRKYLLKKSVYDEDILTKEFLGKCIHLLRNG